MTDIGGTRLRFVQNSWTDVYNALTAGSDLPAGIDAADEYIVPMDVSLGASFHPDLGALSAIIDPTVSVEVSDVVNTLAAGNTLEPLDIFKFGASARLIRFIDVRAGYYAGYVSAGLGADLLFVNLNLAGFMKANSQTVGFSDYGASVELAFRF